MQSLYCTSLRKPCCCKASRTARWYARRKSCPISSAAWYCKSSGLLAILPLPSLEIMRRNFRTCCRFPGSGFLPDGNSISAPWHARVIRRSWPASPKEKRSGGHSILSFLLSYLSRFGKVLLATFSLHFSFVHKMLTFKAPDTPNFRATGATILVLQVEGTKNRRRKHEIFA